MLQGDDIVEAARCWPILIMWSQSRRDNVSRALTADPKSGYMRTSSDLCALLLVESLSDLALEMHIPLYLVKSEDASDLLAT
jgi:hypothetical protein